MRPSSAIITLLASLKLSKYHSQGNGKSNGTIRYLRSFRSLNYIFKQVLPYRSGNIRFSHALNHPLNTGFGDLQCLKNEILAAGIGVSFDQECDVC